MLPDSVLHKQNGHREAPRRPSSTGELLTLVHSAPPRGSDANPDVLRFARLLQSEHPTGMPNDIALPEGVARAVARSQAALDRGELGDVRAALDALQAQADLAARVIAQLVDVVRASDARSPEPAAMRLLDVNDLLVETLGPRVRRGLAVSTVLAPELPSIAGDDRQLSDVLGALLGALAHAGEHGHAPHPIRIDTTEAPGVLRGERIVRIALASAVSGAEEARPLALDEWPDPAVRMDLYRASRIVGEHGGVLSAAALAANGIRFTIELPAV